MLVTRVGQEWGGHEKNVIPAGKKSRYSVHSVVRIANKIPHSELPRGGTNILTTPMGAFETMDVNWLYLIISQFIHNP